MRKHPQAEVFIRYARVANQTARYERLGDFGAESGGLGEVKLEYVAGLEVFESLAEVTMKLRREIFCVLTSKALIVT